MAGLAGIEEAVDVVERGGRFESARGLAALLDLAEVQGRAWHKSLEAY